LAFDAEGYLISAHGEDKNLTRRRTDALNDVTVLADSFQGNALSGPNDIAIDAKGGIYFTDPSGNVAQNSVFYLSPSNELQQVSTGIWFNNGIVLSPDGDTLYVASTLNQNIVAFDVNEDATLSNQRVFVDTLRVDGRTFTPDGMTIDHFGNIYAADLAVTGGLGNFDPTRPGARVWVFNPLGEEVLRFETPDNAASNLLFGPDDILYLTATDALYGVPISFVHEPSLLDFNNDSNVDVLDIDLLVGEIVAGTNDALFDLSGEGNVDDIDLTQWLSDAAVHNGFTEAYLHGDSNLDGSVDATDLNNLALNWRKDEDVAAWSAGDFKADGVVDSGDLNELALNWQDTILPAAATNAPVPEPSTFFLTVIGLTLACRLYRSSATP
jgi:sugar lactone lactonase YvrE